MPFMMSSLSNRNASSTGVTASTQADRNSGCPAVSISLMYSDSGNSARVSRNSSGCSIMPQHFAAHSMPQTHSAGALTGSTMDA